MESLKGKLLLASTQLGDPNFSSTVILIVQHDENGALGLILNRPTETTIQEACSQALELRCAIDDVLYQGGPCQGPLMVVHDDINGSQIDVIDGVHFTTEREEIESLLLNTEAKMKCFVGYSGWAASQLEMEFEAGSWLTFPADADQIFNAPPGDEQYMKLIQKITIGQYIDPERIPEDPNVN
ncbi:MAG: YqgE/AlgH family protein [Anaerolineae bacterium]|nr:YqgE/AlgH family protein [Phycisphaerae bacterium]